MSIKREWTPADMRDAFFPVETRTAFWMGPNNRQNCIPGSKVLVDAERGNPLAVVSDRYRLITNEEAYRGADGIVRGVFTGHSLGDFKCYNVMMPSTRASCRMDFIIPYSSFSAFGDRNEDYVPFVRIANSYNHTLVLKYEIGFCRWICLNGCIFGGTSYKATFIHSMHKRNWHIEDVIEKAREAIGPIENVWASVERKLETLTGIPLPSELALAVFCMVFGIPDVRSEEVSELSSDRYAARAKLFLERVDSYYGEHGANAYAVYNALTDYATFPDGASMTSPLVDGYQRRVGSWTDSLIDASKKQGFSVKDFIGENALSSAESLRGLFDK